MKTKMSQRPAFALLGLAIFFDVATFILGLIMTAGVRCGWMFEGEVYSDESKEIQRCPSPAKTRA